MAKLRILCLHGMAQNPILFKRKTEKFLESVKDHVELVYAKAPHLVLDPEYASIAEREIAAGVEVSEEMRPYTWWFHSRYKPLTEDGYFSGFEESIDYIKGVLLEQGPFDGVLGFSQGACLSAILAHLLERPSVMPELIPSEFEHPPLRFVIIIGGFKPNTQDATEDRLFTSKESVATPSLHIIGQVDTLISPERSEALAATFRSPLIFRHAGGHFVPKSAAARNKLAQFLFGGSREIARY